MPMPRTKRGIRACCRLEKKAARHRAFVRSTCRPVGAVEAIEHCCAGARTTGSASASVRDQRELPTFAHTADPWFVYSMRMVE
jgi:hypothetical protein